MFSVAASPTMYVHGVPVPAAVHERATLLYNNALFIAGGLLCAMATGSTGLYVGRFLGGMAVG